MSGIPVASLSRDRKVAQAIVEALRPDYDVVHCCLNPETALAELPLLFAGLSDIKCASGLGSNGTRPAGQRVLPRAILFGDVPDNSVAQVIAALTTREGVQVPVVRVTKLDILMAGSLTSSPTVIAKVFRKKLGKEKLINEEL